MRIDPQLFAERNVAPTKIPRYVVEIAFDEAATDLYYLTSHSDAALPIAALFIQSTVASVSGTSQRINPLQGRSEIGALTLRLIDRGGAFTALLNGKLVSGDGLRNKRVRVYVGYADLAWDDYVLVQTQIVREVRFAEGVYDLACADIQRAMREDVFDLASEFLTTTIDASTTTIPVTDTSDFEAVTHGPNYSDAPSQAVIYIKIQDEVIRCPLSGVQPDAFTNVVRGVLGTVAEEHTVNADTTGEGRPKVEEYTYLEGPAVKLAYALLTGNVEPDGTTLPASWHLGIDPAFVRLSDFTGIGNDLWVTTNDSDGALTRFVGLKKQDGKRMIEQQICLLISCFMPVYSDGALGLRRMQPVLSTSSHVAVLTDHDVMAAPTLHHVMDDVMNVLDISWNWDEFQERYTRRDILISAQSQQRHGKATPKALKFRGLHGAVHSRDVLNTIFDGLRDRHSGPPLKMTVRVKHRWNTLEVGDVIWLRLPRVRDYVTGTSLDRPFEVQSVRTDWVTGNVTLDLFGSSEKALPLTTDANAPVLPDAYYSIQGVDLNSVLNITLSGSVGHVIANGVLAGGSGMSDTASIYYYIGDLVIDAGVIVSLTGNVQLRVMGALTINGTLSGVGGGFGGGAGLTGQAEPVGAPNRGLPGYLGATFAQHGIELTRDGALQLDFHLAAYSDAVINTVAVGQVAAVPNYNVDIVDGSVTGIPDSLLGTSGAGGGAVVLNWLNGTTQFTTLANGGDGGNGGAGLCVICRGMFFGVSGTIDMSGAAGAQGGLATFEVPPGQLNAGEKFTMYAGAGGGGAPGGLLVLLDGPQDFPALTPQTFVARLGDSPYQGSPVINTRVNAEGGGLPYPVSGIYTAAATIADEDGNAQSLPVIPDYFDSAYRVQYLPANAVAEQDPSVTIVEPPSNLKLASGDAPYVTKAGETIVPLLVNPDGSITPRVFAEWDHSPNTYLAGYKVEFRNFALGEGYVPLSGIIPSTTNSVYLADIEVAEFYDIRVAAVNQFDYQSEWVMGGIIADGKGLAPNPPTSLTAIGVLGGIDLTWTDSSDTDLAYTEVHCASANDFAQATLVARPDSNRYTDPVGTAQTRYYWVRHIDRSGNASSTYPLSATAGVSAASLAVDYDADVAGTPTSLTDINEAEAIAAVSEGLVIDSNFEHSALTWVTVEGTSTPITIGTDTGGTFLDLPETGANYAQGSPTFAVIPGQTYRIRAGLWHTGAPGIQDGLYLRINYSDDYLQPITNGNRSGIIDFIGGGSLVVTDVEAVYEFDWTVPAGVYYGSIAVYNWNQSTVGFRARFVEVLPFGAVSQWGADVTADAVATGIDLTAGYLRRGDDVTLDFDNRSISINNPTFGGDGFQWQWNNGSPRSYQGDGQTRYLKYENGDLELGPDSALLGADSYSNRGVYYHTYFESLTAFWTTIGVGNGAVGYSNTFGRLFVAPGTIVNGYAGISRTIGLPTNDSIYSWGRTRRFLTRIAYNNFGSLSANRYRVGTGQINTGEAWLGFRLENSTLYGETVINFASTTVTLATNIPDHGGYILQAVLIPGVEVQFWVDGVLLGALAQIPAEINDNSNVVFSARAETIGSGGDSGDAMYLSEFRFSQY